MPGLSCEAARRGSHQQAHEAAVAALQEVWPLPWKEASAEAVDAIAHATRRHSEWFWQGAQHLGNGRRRPAKPARWVQARLLNAWRAVLVAAKGAIARLDMSHGPPAHGALTD
jgi:hypothetical protein